MYISYIFWWMLLLVDSLPFPKSWFVHPDCQVLFSYHQVLLSYHHAVNLCHLSNSHMFLPTTEITMINGKTSFYVTLLNKIRTIQTYNFTEREKNITYWWKPSCYGGWPKQQKMNTKHWPETLWNMHWIYLFRNLSHIMYTHRCPCTR